MSDRLPDERSRDRGRHLVDLVAEGTGLDTGLDTRPGPATTPPRPRRPSTAGLLAASAGLLALLALVALLLR